VYGGEKPLKIIAGGHLNAQGADESSSATLIYSKGRIATLMTNIRVEFPNDALVIGTKGIITVGANSIVICICIFNPFKMNWS
jgi:hypothetical protein